MGLETSTTSISTSTFQTHSKAYLVDVLGFIQAVPRGAGFPHLFAAGQVHKRDLAVLLETLVCDVQEGVVGGGVAEEGEAAHERQSIMTRKKVNMALVGQGELQMLYLGGPGGYCLGFWLDL